MDQSPTKLAFGDFQTPLDLASAVCQFVARTGFAPHTIVEPTCGVGNFLLAGARTFPRARHVLGVEINQDYFKELNERVRSAGLTQTVDLRLMDFFGFNWNQTLSQCPKPILVVGNLPWVTASRLGALGSTNLPEKSNFQDLKGLDAKTGRSNFDIAEWMMIHLLEQLAGTACAVAMLLKSSVVRRLLIHAWKRQWNIGDAAFLKIDAQQHFGASADAGLFFCRLGTRQADLACTVASFESPECAAHQLAIRNGELTADAAAFDETCHLATANGLVSAFRWRSGVKHDCSRVLELRRTPEGLINGHGQQVDIEPDHLYPLLKGSAVGSGRDFTWDRHLLLPQRAPNEDTLRLAKEAPRTWQYLAKHQPDFDRRKSSIYRGRPPFSVFGIGPYTFRPWKLAICGLYKHFRFVVVGPRNDRPVVFDDTVYILSCEHEEEAMLLSRLLVSPPAQAFLNARVFWDAKRPITVDLLQRLDLLKLATCLGEGEHLCALRKRTGQPLVNQESLFAAHG